MKIVSAVPQELGVSAAFIMVTVVMRFIWKKSANKCMQTGFGRNCMCEKNIKLCE